ncbi:hypothetical protein G7Y79_00008g024580 [Physcia stellaris]|nr:hypothetical protein G7Y79_00008g024580 [Physcia stellaris]
MGLGEKETQTDLGAVGRRIHQRLLSLEPYDQLTTQAQRYELWAESLGVYHLGHSSLDYRFRDAPSIHGLTHRLLSHLEETLSTVEEIASQGAFGLPRNTASFVGTADAGCAGDEDESVSSLDSDEKEMLASYADESLSDMILARLESIIDRLYRLSFRIRNPATRLGTSKASGYCDIDDDTGIDLIEMLAEADRRHVHELLKQMSGASLDDYNDHYLVYRLSQANTLRRKQFGQWRQHKKKLEGLSQHEHDSALKKHVNDSRGQLPIVDGNNPPTLLPPGNIEPDEGGSANAQLDLGSRDSKLSSLAFSSLYESSGDVGATEDQIPKTDLTINALKALPDSAEVDLSDYLGNGDNLVSIYMGQGRWEEAAELEKKAMETSKKVLGEEHSDTLTIMINLALIYRAQGRWEKAEELQLRVVEIRKRKWGAEHSDTLASMANLALIYRAQGRWEKAEELQLRVMEIIKRKWGTEHPDTLASMANLASIYRGQEHWAEAEKLEVGMMETRTTPSAPESPRLLEATHWLPKIFEQSHPITKFLNNISERSASSRSVYELMLNTLLGLNAWGKYAKCEK